jgi:uncharacterized protein (TIGR03435 family)
MRNFILFTAYVCLVQGAEEPGFDSVTFARNRSGQREFHAQMQLVPGPAKVTMRNVSLSFLVQQAYRVNESQITGPGWIKKTGYDLDATLARASQWEEVRAALRNLLANRLQLVVRREERDSPVYALTIAASGPKLHPPTNTKPAAQSRDAMSLSDSMDLNDASVAAFCEALSRRMGRLVVDQTGIEGKFDFELKYGSNRQIVGPTVFKAVERQLGLKLIESRAPVEHLNIEHALKDPVNGSAP